MRASSSTVKTRGNEGSREDQTTPGFGEAVALHGITTRLPKIALMSEGGSCNHEGDSLMSRTADCESEPEGPVTEQV